MTVVRIVEDNVVVRELVSHICEKVGFDVLADAPSADLFRPPAWDGVTAALVDLNLGTPVLTGFDVLRWLLLHAPDIRRVVMSSLISPSDGRDIEAAGLAHAILAKPFTGAELCEAVGVRSDA